MPDVHFAARLAIGLLFGLSSAAKVMNRRKFTLGVREYAIVPVRLAGPAAWCIIASESFVSFSHLTGWGFKAGGALCLLLLATFFIAVSVNLVRRRVLPCHCFGSSDSQVISPKTLIRLAVLMGCEALLLSAAREGAGMEFRTPGEALLPAVWALLMLIVGLWIENIPALVRFWGRARKGEETASTL